MGRTKRSLLSVFVSAAIVLATLGLVEGSAGASSSYYHGQINSLRSSRGLSSLQIDSGLAASAQYWASHMAATGNLEHDPTLATGASGYTSIAENVGYGSNPEIVWKSFNNSSSHYQTLVNASWTHMGVGVATDSQGQTWTAHRFMAKASAAPAPTPPPAPSPAPAASSTPSVPDSSPWTGTEPSNQPDTSDSGNDDPAETDEPAVAGTTGSFAGPTTDEISTQGKPPADPKRVSVVLNALNAIPG